MHASDTASDTTVFNHLGIMVVLEGLILSLCSEIKIDSSGLIKDCINALNQGTKL